MGHLFRRLAGGMLLLVALTPLKIAAQAFDGDMDSRIHAGYLGMEGLSGVELELIDGLNDYLSYGGFARAVFDKDAESNIRCLDLGASLYFHWDELLRLPEKLDLHTGFQISWQSGWVAGGLRYNFSERWGVYARAQKGLFDVLHSKEFDNPFAGRKFGFSVGLTYSL